MYLIREQNIKNSVRFKTCKDSIAHNALIMRPTHPRAHTARNSTQRQSMPSQIILTFNAVFPAFVTVFTIF